MTEVFDVLVIGAGLVGSAIARELAGYELSVALVEGRPDIGDGTSKANTAILHTGFDAKPDTLEARLVVRGATLLRDYATATGIPVERVGALLVAWTAEELAALPALRAKALRNGYEYCEIVDSSEIYGRVPDLGPGALGGLTVPDESITCTWTTNLALATDAVRRGVRLYRGQSVIDVTRVRPANGAEYMVAHTEQDRFAARWVVNAAGLGAQKIDEMFGFSRFASRPRRGELLVFDKLARRLAPMIVLPVPTAKGKGVLISPTVYGNVMLGPTAEELPDPAATNTSEAGLTYLRELGARLMPALMDEEVTAMYAGMRAGIDSDDYLIELSTESQYLLVGGIRSTGLTASLAIGEYVAELLSTASTAPGGQPSWRRRTDLPAPPRMANLGEAFPRPYQDADRIAADPRFGAVVCFCERVTLGEVEDACRGLIPPADLDGLRRRTRARNGRCQGFFCGARLQQILATELAARPDLGGVR